MVVSSWKGQSGGVRRIEFPGEAAGANQTMRLPSLLPILHVKSGLDLFGIGIQQDTRCQHWFSDLDVIAIKFKCCGKYYPCYSCHESVADHPAKRWKQDEFDEKAILCGKCGTQLTISKYLSSNNVCSNNECQCNFNPGCAKHYDIYFDVSIDPDLP